MLVRSSSTPLLNSWIPSAHSYDHSPECEPHHHLSKPHSISLAPHSDSAAGRARTMSKVRSETDLGEHKRGTFGRRIDGFAADEEEEGVVMVGYSARDRLFSSSGLGEVVEEDGVGGGIGRNIGSGRFNGDGDDDARADDYYQKMIEGDPRNGLLLGNYAKFLKEVRGDVVRAEEYCERAILANVNDANVVALYAELIWEVHRDASRAEKYFDQAVQAEPNDCYVMASYARFLWDTEAEEVNEEVNEEDNNVGTERYKSSLTRQQPDSFQGAVYPTISAY